MKSDVDSTGNDNVLAAGNGLDLPESPIKILFSSHNMNRKAIKMLEWINRK